MDRFYQLLLLAYPRSFRQVYAAGIAETFARRKADVFATRGWIGRGWFLIRETLGLLCAGLGQHRDQRRAKLRSAQHVGVGNRRDRELDWERQVRGER